MAASLRARCAETRPLSGQLHKHQTTMYHIIIRWFNNKSLSIYI